MAKNHDLDHLSAAEQIEHEQDYAAWNGGLDLDDDQDYRDEPFLCDDDDFITDDYPAFGGHHRNEDYNEYFDF